MTSPGGSTTVIHLNLGGEPLTGWQVSSSDGDSASHASEIEPAAIEAVLFDKDGTMSHSEPMLEALATARVFHCLEALSEQGLSEQQRSLLEDLLRRAYGLGPDGIHPASITAVASRAHNLIATATALAMVGLGWPEAQALTEEVFARTDGLHGQGSRHRPQPTDGLAELLERLSAAGLRCAVISNDHEEGILDFLEIHGFRHHFQAIWSAEHQPCKPHPDAVHGVCRELNIDANRCALIGDANSDLRMARQAGVPVILGYRAGWREPPPLDPDVPQLHHWRELTVSH
ncbi:MAG: HAD family hydrolase [Cyanobium sp.]